MTILRGILKFRQEHQPQMLLEESQTALNWDINSGILLFNYTWTSTKSHSLTLSEDLVFNKMNDYSVFL